MASVLDLALDADTYIALLSKFMDVAEHVQNAPSLGLIPKEDLISDIVLEELSPYLKQNGGVIEAKRIAFHEGRGHLILQYPGATKPEETINFVGMHMDVVPANPEGWERDPFKLSMNEDISALEGRGPHSKYTLPKEELVGKLELTLGDHSIEGIACALDSIGFQSFSNATKEVKGESTPFAIMGSLPLVRDLQRAGLDLTLAGFGKSSVYHGDNEFCSLADMQDALLILGRFIHNVDSA
ncbi:acetylornithine deacetylase [Saprolegnia diclina VS20]|uniref:Acetylornithine deacetylase n=1 Tax=Saprolegnia diclina (strain VS20) TaxID=1156394 RepID=T0PNK0_SAPDV|nr:acetylornithine deacetylase [Saprolegnia diclina VS20]EQC26969.1 acetylornithine deacetylase [Saprolegnia diclina VS20]|eukprot:XP_008619571.1 acetylornithine deacetylase [Saprolegnia diclina VS20]